MEFWTAITVICVLSITTTFVLKIIKHALRHNENIERIRAGYPTLEGDVSLSLAAGQSDGLEERPLPRENG